MPLTWAVKCLPLRGAPEQSKWVEVTSPQPSSLDQVQGTGHAKLGGILEMPFS